MTAQGAQILDFEQARARKVRRVNEPRVTKRELAKLHRVSVRTVERWMSDPRYRRGGRQVPYRQPFGSGSAVRFVVADVEAWLEAPQTPAPQDKDGPQ